MEKRADVTFPKTKCDLCPKPCVVVERGVALCASCRKIREARRLEKSAGLGQDTYEVPER